MDYKSLVILGKIGLRCLRQINRQKDKNEIINKIKNEISELESQKLSLIIRMDQGIIKDTDAKLQAISIVNNLTHRIQELRKELSLYSE